MALFEIEIKSLLGSKERTREVKNKLHVLDPKTSLISKHKQLNHYFSEGNPAKLYEPLSARLEEKGRQELKSIIENGSNFSIRTRLMDTERLLFVIKASLDEGTSHNTISRKEFEAEIKGMKLEELDRLILDAGFKYQAKWSREREEYKSAGVTVCFDKNAGYGYLAEFEKVVEDESFVPKAREELFDFMRKLGVAELPQDRLERMFKYYNENWRDYYGTEKIFNIL